VLVIVIGTIWLGLALFALKMVRLAAVSDDAHAAAIAEHIAANERAGQGRMATDGPVEQSRFGCRRDAGARPMGYAGEERKQDSSRIQIN
jgi:hypothetical protein